MADKARKKGEKQPSFEENLERLEQIVHELEEGEIGLEQSLKRYEEGVKLLRQGFQMLEGAERRIELLTGIGEKGEPLTEPFDATATAERSAADRSGSKKGGRGARNATRAKKSSDEGAEEESEQLF